jgi:hypothetical protein
MMDISSLFQNAALPLVLLAAALDVTANMLLVRSDSFRRRAVGLLALCAGGAGFLLPFTGSSSYGFGRGLRHVGRFWRAWHIPWADGCCCSKSSTPAHLQALPCLSAAWCCCTQADLGPDSCFQENV